MWQPREDDTLKETSIEGGLAEHGDVAGFKSSSNGLPCCNHLSASLPPTCAREKDIVDPLARHQGALMELNCRDLSKLYC